MENLLNKETTTPKYPPRSWTARRATAYGYIFTQDATSTTITGVVDVKTFTGNKIIPDSINNKPVTGIKDMAFRYCKGLTGIVIPHSVTSIGNSAFFNCPELTSITSSSPNYRVEAQRYLIRNSDNSLIAFAPYDIASVVIPNSATNIRRWLFYGYKNLTSVSIPSSVTNIEIYAFSHCSGLTSINIAKPYNSISGAPWAAPKATVNWEDYKG